MTDIKVIVSWWYTRIKVQMRRFKGDKSWHYKGNVRWIVRTEKKTCRFVLRFGPILFDRRMKHEIPYF